VYRLLTAPARIGRFFDASGNAVSRLHALSQGFSRHNQQQQRNEAAPNSMSRDCRHSMPKHTRQRTPATAHRDTYNIFEQF
jgi:hypothetical protein